ACTVTGISERAPPALAVTVACPSAIAVAEPVFASTRNTLGRFDSHDTRGVAPVPPVRSTLARSVALSPTRIGPCGDTVTRNASATGAGTGAVFVVAGGGAVFGAAFAGS